MTGHIKWALLGVLVASAIWAGWAVNGWRISAAHTEQYRLELRNELRRRVAADAARIRIQQELDATQARVVERVKIVKQTVTKYVQANSDCDLPQPVAGELQRLRSGNLSSTSNPVADPGGAAGPDR